MRNRARVLRREARALRIAVRDARVPWYARAFLVLVVAYALSPVDLIPDFIPVLGHVDDLVLVPLGVFLAAKMIPEEVLVEARRKADAETEQDAATGPVGVAVAVGVWVFLLGLCAGLAAAAARW